MFHVEHAHIQPPVSSVIKSYRRIERTGTNIIREIHQSEGTTFGSKSGHVAHDGCWITVPSTTSVQHTYTMAHNTMVFETIVNHKLH